MSLMADTYTVHTNGVPFSCVACFAPENSDKENVYLFVVALQRLYIVKKGKVQAL